MPGLGLGIGIGKIINRFLEIKTLAYMLSASLKRRADYYENSASTEQTLGEIETIQGNLLRKSSLIFTPTAYNDGEALCVKPSDGSGDFQFSRNSAATRVNAQGLVEDVQILSSNLVQNGDFSNGSTDWAIENTWTIGDGVASGNGANGAGAELKQNSILPIGKKFKVTYEIKNYVSGTVKAANGATNSGNGIYTDIIISARSALAFLGTNFFGDITNISAKEITNDTNIPRLDFQDFTYQDILGSEEITNGDFATDTNWTKGTGTTISGGKLNINANSTDDRTLQNIGMVQNKTYKITFEISNYQGGALSILFGGSSTPTIGILNSDGSYSFIQENFGANSFFYFKGNLFIGSIDNVSVKEYLGQEVVPDSGCGSWLFEPQSTNLVKQSNLLVAIGGGVVTLNAAISPDGTQNASKVFFSTVVNYGAKIDLKGSSASPSTEYTFSFYAKNSSGNGTFNLRVDTDTLTSVGNETFTVTSDWIRYTHTFTTDALASSFSSNSRFRKSSTDNNEVLIWGLQLELGLQATSYIPTSGAIATRLADLVTGAGDSSTFNSTEGVLYAEIAALANDGTSKFISLSDATNDNILRLEYTTTGNQINCQYKKSGINQANLTSNLNALNSNKIAIKYKVNDFALWVNGVEVATDNSGSVNIEGTFTQLNFARVNAFPFYGKTKTIAVFSEALTDEELAQLTTI